jgi:hypothetical protein
MDIVGLKEDNNSRRREYNAHTQIIYNKCSIVMK